MQLCNGKRAAPLGADVNARICATKCVRDMFVDGLLGRASHHQHILRARRRVLWGRATVVTNLRAKCLNRSAATLDGNQTHWWTQFYAFNTCEICYIRYIQVYMLQECILHNIRYGVGFAPSGRLA